MYAAMEIPSRRNSCYCCVTTPATTNSNIDNALHELGMLSTVTESRRQYLRERADRARAKSESDKEIRLRAATDSNAGVQILQMDPKYVVGVSTTHDDSSIVSRETFFGDFPIVDPKAQEYLNRDDDEVIEMDVASKFTSFASPMTQMSPRRQRCLRVSRSNRARRTYFKRKPYELPRGRLSRSVEEQTTTASATLSTRPTTQPKNDIKYGLSAIFHRSKSLDDLDVAKLQLTDRQERQEIETMSDHLRDLNVNDQTMSATAI